MNKGQLIKQLTDKFFLRFHMSFMLSLTVLSGYAVTKGLYALGVTNLTLRYSLSFIASYLVFFLLVRIWLYYIFATRNHSENKENDWDLWDFDTWFISSGKKVPGAFKGGGGKFSGGGASGSFDSAAESKVPLVAAAYVPPVESKSSGFDLPDLDLDLDGDAAPLVVVVLVVGVILMAVGSLFYLVFNAPMIMGEIAFQLALSVGVLKSADRKAGPFSWLETAFSKTWPMALVLLILIIATTLTVNHYKPEITKSSEIKAWILEK